MTLYMQQTVTYTRLYSIISTLLTLPVLSATSERSLSGRRHVKSYLSLTMGDKRSSNLSLKCIYTDMCKSTWIWLLYPRSPKGEGGYTVLPLSVCRPSKIFCVTLFSVTVDGRNLIFGHKHHIGIPYCG